MIKRLGTLVLSCVAALGMVCALSGCATQTYTPEAKTPTVQPEVIGQAGVLRVGVNTQDNTPFAGQVSGRIVGLDVDIAAAIADNLGLKLEVVDVGTDPDTALTAGTVDIVMGVDKSDDSQLACWTSDAYIESGVALFAKPEQTTVPTSTTAARIAAQSSSMSAWEVTNQLGDNALLATSDLQSAFDQLSSGSADYVAADAVIGTYAAHTSDIDVHIVALMQQPSGYCVGVLDSNTDLKTTISDVLATLTSNGAINVIEKKWLGSVLDLASLPLTEGATSRTSNGTGSDAKTDASESTTGDSDGGTEANGTGTGAAVEEAAGANAVQPEDDEDAAA